MSAYKAILSFLILCSAQIAFASNLSCVKCNRGFLGSLNCSSKKIKVSLSSSEVTFKFDATSSITAYKVGRSTHSNNVGMDRFETLSFNPLESGVFVFVSDELRDSHNGFLFITGHKNGQTIESIGMKCNSLDSLDMQLNQNPFGPSGS
jgi:hypothetical protein